MDDAQIVARITELVAEEDRLRDLHPEQAPERRAQLEVTLDQCWDLRRQRRTRLEFGQNPDQAQLRNANVVETYRQ